MSDINAIGGNIGEIYANPLTPEERAEFRRQWAALYLRHERFPHVMSLGNEDSRIRRLFEEHQDSLHATQVAKMNAEAK